MRTDLVVVHGDLYTGQRPSELQIWSPDYPAGQICEGMIRMAQRFIIELFTDRGSIRYSPNRGCTFYREIINLNNIAHIQIYSIFNRAVHEITPALHGGEFESDDPSEQFQRADLLDITIDSTLVNLFINVLSVAGTSVIIKIPMFSINEGSRPVINNL